MTVATLRVPGSMTGDPGDVTVALEIARAFWEKGDHEEAVRWLKRAGEAAGEAGDAPRSASLAQAAVELEAVFKSRREAISQAAGVSRPPPPSASEVESSSTLVWGRDGRLRVSVKTSVRDPNLLLVRPLLEGQHPQAGAREGFLVLLQSDADGPSKWNGGGAE